MVQGAVEAKDQPPTDGERAELEQLRKRVQELESSQALLAWVDRNVPVTTALERGNDVIEVTDAQGRLVYVNPAFERQLGYSAQQALGRTPAELLRSGLHSREYYEDIWAQVSSGAMWSGRIISKSRDGELRYFDAMVYPIRDAAGLITNYISVKRDVASVLRAEAEVDRLRRDMQQIIERNADGIVIVRDGLTLFTNTAWARIRGASHTRELLGEPILDAFIEEDRALLAELLAAPERFGPAISLRVVSRTRGRVSISAEQLEQIDFNGAPALALFARDVTEPRARQARLLLADRMLSVSTLAAGVAHEINNPLSYVIGNLSLLAEELPALAVGLEEKAQSELAETLEEARDGAERIRRIVADMQAFARPDHQSGAVDVRRSVEVAINMAWIEIRHRARLVRDFREVPKVPAAEARVGQAFLSLLLNAAQSLPEGSADKNEIKVSIRPHEEWVLVEVQDSGPGLTPVQVARIFDPFGALEPGNKASLGLSIAHSIVSDLGGRIDVESAPGRGTLFRVHLPKAGEALVAASRSMRVSSGGAKVLIVDDELPLANALKRALREHVVEVVTSGRAAIDLLTERSDFDLIFCDLMMAELTGMDVYEWVKLNRPGMESRMIFMTGGTFTERAEDFLSRVPNHWIEKPFDLARVREFVRGRGALELR